MGTRQTRAGHGQRSPCPVVDCYLRVEPIANSDLEHYFELVAVLRREIEIDTLGEVAHENGLGS